jgi:hypothetical protein
MAIAEHAQISGIDMCVSSGKIDEFRLNSFCKLSD